MRNRIGRLGGEMRGRTRSRRARARREMPRSNACPTTVTASHVLEHRIAQSRRTRREEIGAVQREAGAHARIVASELLAEVQPFLRVRYARRELATEREPPAPRAATVSHRDQRLLLGRATRRTRARARRRARPARAPHRDPPRRRSRCRGTRRRSRGPRRDTSARARSMTGSRSPATRRSSRVPLEQRAAARARPEVAHGEAAVAVRARDAAQVAQLGPRRHRNVHDRADPSRASTRRGAAHVFRTMTPDREAAQRRSGRRRR